MFFGDIFWMSFECLLDRFSMSFECFWMFFGYLLDVF